MPLINTNIARVFPGFFMGCLTCVFWKYMNGRGKAKPLGAVSLAVVVSACTTWLINMPDGRLVFDYDHAKDLLAWSILVFPALIVAVLNINTLNGFFSVRVFRWLGNLSFGIYLIHTPVMRIVDVVIDNGILPLSRTQPTRFVTLGLVLLLAHVSYYRFERPAQKWIREKYYKYKAGAIEKTS